MTNHSGKLLALGSVSLLLTLSGCARRETAAEKGIRTQTLLVGNAAEPADLDPHVINAFTDSHIAYALFEGLVQMDAKTSEVIPAAAERWEVSPDGLVYTFHLRKGARWSNGDPLTAGDFAYSFHRILIPEFGALYSYMLWPIKNAEAFNGGRVKDFSQVGVKALDEMTLELTLERPTPALLAMATHTTWLPVHQAVVEKYGPMEKKGTLWTRAGNLVGNGAFMLSEWIPNARITVSKNPYYWNAAKVRLNKIEFFPFEKRETEDLNYRSGQLHTTYGIPISKVEAYRAHRPVDMRIDPVLSTFYLFINTTRPPFDNVKLRQALNHAISRNAMAADLNKGVDPPAHTFTPPNCAGYTCRTQVTDDYDLARKLLAEAGYPGGKGLPPIEVLSYETESSIRMLEAIQATWQKELGVHITIAQLEMKTLFQTQQDKNYSIAFSAWIADFADPVTFLGMMVTGGGNNWAGWSNKEYDRLIAEAANTADNSARMELFQKAEAILLDQAPLIPLFYQPQVYAINPAVRGWETSILGFHNWDRIWLEK